MPKETGIAFRRSKLSLKKKKALEIYPGDDLATNANHLKECSCWMCGNPRKYKEKTIKDIRESLITE